MASQTINLTNRDFVNNVVGFYENTPRTPIINALKINASDPRFVWDVDFRSNNTLTLTLTDSATSSSEEDVLVGPNEDLSDKFETRGSITFTLISGTARLTHTVDMASQDRTEPYEVTVPATVWQWLQNNSGGSLTLTLNDTAVINLAARATTGPATARMDLWLPSIAARASTELPDVAFNLRGGTVLGAQATTLPAGAQFQLAAGDARGSTLADLRAQLALLVGYDADPDAANAPFLNLVLKLAQERLYEQLTGWNREVVDFTLTTEIGVWQYAWPENLDLERIQYVYVRHPSSSVYALREGFDEYEYQLRESFRSWPSAFRRRATFQIWPSPDGPYEIIMGAQRTLAPLVADSDQATVPDDILLSQAVVQVYQRQGRQPPVEEMRNVRARIGQIRARSHLPSYTPGGYYRRQATRPLIATPRDA